MLLLRLSGWLLLRLAERRLLGLLFHEPPRRTREDGAVQAPGRNAKRKRSPETEDEGSSTTQSAASPKRLPVIPWNMHYEIKNRPPPAEQRQDGARGSGSDQDVKM